MAEQPLFDEAVLAKLQGMVGPRVLGEIIDMFCEHKSRRVDAFRAAQRSGDLAAAAEVLHAIKGSAGVLGIRGLESLTQRMETAARDEDGETVTALAAEFERVYREAAAFLVDRKKELG